MKDARNIFALVALALTLGAYDMLKEWMNFSTVVALIVVLALSAFWLIVYVLLSILVFNKSPEDRIAGEDRKQQKIRNQKEKRQAKADAQAAAKTAAAAKAAAKAAALKAPKKTTPAIQKQVEQKKPEAPRPSSEAKAATAQSAIPMPIAIPEPDATPEPKPAASANSFFGPQKPFAPQASTEQKSPFTPQTPPKPNFPNEPQIPIVAGITALRQIPLEPTILPDSTTPAASLATEISTEKLLALEKILIDSCSAHGISGASIVTHGGILLVSTPFAGSHQDDAIAVCASSYILGTRMSIYMGRERLKELVIRGDEGFLFMRDIADQAFLILTVEHGILIGGVIQEAARCANSAADVLKR